MTLAKLSMILQFSLLLMCLLHKLLTCVTSVHDLVPHFAIQLILQSSQVHYESGETRGTNGFRWCEARLMKIDGIDGVNRTMKWFVAEEIGLWLEEDS